MTRDPGGLGGRPPGSSLPAGLARRLADGGWIRTAHRGAPRIAPGNTLRALEAAADLGVDLVEIDVRPTSDGRLALWHDDAVRVGGRRLEVAATPLADLRAAVREGLDEELVDLDTAVAALKGRAGLMVDLKAPGLVAQIVRSLEGAGFADAVVCGDYWDDLRRLAHMAPAFGTSLTLGALWREGGSGPRLEEIDTDAVTVSWRHATRDLVARCHDRGIAVLAWTVDRPSTMRRLLRLGVDGLTSNRPDVLMTLPDRRP